MSSPPVQAEVFVPFTKAEHIQQLNDIDKSIHQLLKSAGMALSFLSSPDKTPAHTISERKQEFERATDNYLTTLQSIDVSLRRKIWALEEAGIIVEKKVRDAQEQKTGEKPEKESEGGTGKLDIGWLNSRSGKVGRDMEAELWEKAKVFLEGVTKGFDEGDGDEVMED